MKKKLGGFHAFTMGSIFTSFFWIIACIAQGAPTGAGWAIGMFFIMSFLNVFAGQAELRGGRKKWHRSGLVISPLGLGIIQGKIRGEMKWRELQGVQFPAKVTVITTSDRERQGSIRLSFGDSSVEIQDIYCHRLSIIHDKIKHYWQG